MVKKKISSYGSWASMITADLILSQGLGLSEIHVDGEDIYWLESRPRDNGRSVIVRKSADGQVLDAIPEGFNVRNGVHEYGGGSYAVSFGNIYFTNWEDQRIYYVGDTLSPTVLTSDGEISKGIRYADLTIEGRWLICVRERHHTDSEPTNDLIAISVNRPHIVRILASGQNFYSSPRLSLDGKKICWLSWNHPNMPWDGCMLSVADFNDDGVVSNIERVTGSETESIVQPGWSPNGDLFFFTDESGWWNLTVWNGETTRSFLAEEVDYAEAPWQFGHSVYSFLRDGSLVLGTPAVVDSALLRRFNSSGNELSAIVSTYSKIRYVRTVDQRIIYLGASPTSLPEIVVTDLRTGVHSILKKSSSLDLDVRYISKPRVIQFPTTDDGQAHGFYYDPQNPHAQAGKKEKPPLLVMTHGGPTGETRAELNLRVQFWTSRGFAVVDVNYRGSTGHGRRYRESLNGMWGVYDAADCIAATDYLVKQGLVDADRLIIRGSSAGGYTVINALRFYDRFAAGASYYGIADLEAMVNDTHKFESRYLDTLIGPYPDARDIYHDRSAIHFSERLSCPMILFQGLEDGVVPPSQAEKMSKSLRQNRIPFAYVPFEGEQHGFRQAKNIKRALEAELYFYGRVMGFMPADQIDPIEIENSDLLSF